MKKREKLACIFRAEASGNDLLEDDCSGNLCVMAQGKNGDLYKLGHVSRSFCLSNPEAAMKSIKQIKEMAVQK